MIKMAKYKKIDGYAEYVACEHCGGTKIIDVCYAGCTTDINCLLCGEYHEEHIIFDEKGDVIWEENVYRPQTKLFEGGGFGTAELKMRKGYAKFTFESKEEALECLAYVKSGGYPTLIPEESYIYIFDKEKNEGELVFGYLENNGHVFQGPYLWHMEIPRPGV